MLSLSLIYAKEWMALRNWALIYSGVDVFIKEDMYISHDYGVGLARTKEW